MEEGCHGCIVEDHEQLIVFVIQLLPQNKSLGTNSFKELVELVKSQEGRLRHFQYPNVFLIELSMNIWWCYTIQSKVIQLDSDLFTAFRSTNFHAGW